MSDNATYKLVKQLEELKNSISLYQDIIYKVGRGGNSKSGDTTLPAPKSSVQAIIDVALLSKAHTTKVGIAFKPPISVDAASKTLADSAALIPALVGAFVAINDDSEKANKVGTLVLGEVGNRVLDFLSAQKKLLTELRLLTISTALDPVPESGETETDELKEVGDRLASVGQAWKACDALVAIPTLRSAKLLEEKIQQFSSMMEDVISDLEEYVENGAQEGFDDLLAEWDSDDDNDDDDDDEEEDKEEKQTSKSKKVESKEEEDDDDEDDDDNDDDEQSELQALASKYKSDLALLLQFYQGGVIAQALKNPQDVTLHQSISGALSDMAEKLDDLVGAFMEGEEDEESITEMYSEIKQDIKKLTDLVSSAPVKSPDMEGLVDGLVQKLNL